MYYLPQPPFLLSFFGLFIGITCGSAFQALINESSQNWKKNPTSQDAYTLKGANLMVTYWGICLGIWVFLGGGLQIFGFDPIFAYGISLPLTIATAALVWTQLNQVLLLLQKGGSKAIDLDYFT